MRGRPKYEYTDKQLARVDWSKPNHKVARTLQISLSTAIKLRKALGKPSVKRGRPFGS